MRILITGANGLLGGFLVPELVQNGHTVLATGIGPCRLSDIDRGLDTSYASLDITDAMAVHELVHRFAPDYIIHAAAITAADDCELDPVRCWNVNVTATRFIISAAREVSAHLIYVSTDFVFDGEAGPYDEMAIPAPVNYYGCSKLTAEKAVCSSGLPFTVIRTVLVYGHSDNIARSSLMTWVRSKLSAGERIRVVTDQQRTPTYAGDLARGIRLAAEKNATGIFHISGGDMLSPYEMALMTADHLGLDKNLMEQVNADTFSQPARRPLRTGFIIDKASRELGYSPVSFREGLVLSLTPRSI
jgi:dTDP-4-dehydrorhamnose reductase